MMMRNRPFAPCRLLSAACLLLVLMTVPVGSQTIDCSASASGENYQVYLDELTFAREVLKNDSQLQNLMARLSFKLRSRMDTLRQETGPVPIVVDFCAGRKPEGEAIFTRRLVESLDDNEVILELWGQLDGQSTNGTIVHRTARIFYVLVPVLLEEFGNPLKPGMQLVEYPKSPAADRELIDLLEQSGEIEAFVAVGVGVNLLRNNQYDQAMRFLCKAQCLLQLEDPQQPAPSRQELQNFIQQSARRTIESAGADSSYQGALKDLVDPSSPCPCERSVP
jgi:hypothetical protein